MRISNTKVAQLVEKDTLENSTIVIVDEKSGNELEFTWSEFLGLQLAVKYFINNM